MIITPEATHHAPSQMVNFYKKHFNNVHSVNCSVCENTIAIELSDPITNDLLGLTPNSQGVIILPVDDKLLASRVRLDGMLGYQCGGTRPNPAFISAKKTPKEQPVIPCGNDTRASDIEERHSPTGEFMPHEVAAIHEAFLTEGWQAPIEHKNGKEHRGSFAVERL
jgi:hypothetical protein